MLATMRLLTMSSGTKNSPPPPKPHVSSSTAGGATRRVLSTLMALANSTMCVITGSRTKAKADGVSVRRVLRAMLVLLATIPSAASPSSSEPAGLAAVARLQSSVEESTACSLCPSGAPRRWRPVTADRGAPELLVGQIWAKNEQDLPISRTTGDNVADRHCSVFVSGLPCWRFAFGV